MSGLHDTGRGRSTGRPKPRPDHDSLPHHDCDVESCGLVRPFGVTTVGYHLDALEDTRSKNCGPWFCSLGCLGRWAAREELRQ